MALNPEPLHARVYPATTGGGTRSCSGRFWMVMLIGLLSLVWAVRGTVPAAASATAPEVILAALRAFAERERIYKGRFEELRGEIMVGVEASKRGEVVDGETVFSQLEQKLLKSRSQAGE